MTVFSVADQRRTPGARGRKLTSVELPPDLLRAARVYAVAHGITLRVLIEQGLRARLRQKTEARMQKQPRREGAP